MSYHLYLLSSFFDLDIRLIVNETINSQTLNICMVELFIHNYNL